MVDEFPHTVEFQEYTEVPDGYGGYTKDWTTALTTEAFVDPISGSQRYQAMQQTNPTNMRIYYPFQEGVKASMRAIWTDRDMTLKIQSQPIDQGGQGEIYMVECLVE